MPWLLLPALLLVPLEFGTRGFELFWSVQSLFIPMSAWIGYRYGVRGFRVVLVASIFVVLCRFSNGILDFRISYGLIGSYASSGLFLAWLLCEKGRIERISKKLEEQPALLWLVLLLPISYWLRFDSNIRIITSGTTIILTVGFILGFLTERKYIRSFISIIFVMFLLGVVIHFIIKVSPEYGDLYDETGMLQYDFKNPRSLIVALFAYMGGVWSKEYLSTGELPFARSRIPFVLVLFGMLLVSIVYARVIVSVAPPELKFSVYYQVLGHWYFSAFCFFLIGWFYGMRWFLPFCVPVILVSLIMHRDNFSGFEVEQRVGALSLLFEISGRTFRETWWVVQFLLWTAIGEHLRKMLKGEVPHHWDVPKDGVADNNAAGGRHAVG